MMKNFAVTFLLSALFLLPVSTGYADVNSGLTLYYSFNEDRGNFAADESGNNHDATVFGASYSPNGRFKGAYHFDGVDDYILAGDLGYHETGTISFWMNSDAVENWRNPFSTNYAGWDDNIRFEENSKGDFSGGGHGLGRGDIFTSTLAAKRWYHIAYVWDQAYVYGYLDGALIFKNPHPDPNSKVHPDLPLTAGEYKQNTLNFRNVAIGNGYSTEPSRYWKGYVDEVRIYNRPLSAQEVLSLYRGPSDGLILAYSFDKNDGTSVRDNSGNGHIGTISGAKYSSQGKYGGAYYFDGVDDQIFIPRSTMLDIGNTFTLAAWYKIYDTKQGPIIEWNDGSRSGLHMWVNVTGYQWQGKGSGANIVDIDGNEIDHVISTDNLSINQWHHIAVTYNGGTGEAAVYLDGRLREEKNLGTFTPQTSFDVYIGKRPQGPVFRGLLDDIKIYNRVLSKKEIRQLSDALGHGIIYQNFEAGNTSDPYGWPIVSGVTTALSTEQFHSGKQSWKCTIPAGLPPGIFGGTAVATQIQPQRWHTDFEVSRHDRLSFWVWANPSNNAPNTVAVQLFDHNKYADGFWVWTTKPAQVRQWTQLYILFSQLPSDFQLNDVDKIAFYHYWDGQYYLDDVTVGGNDRIYQAFESWSCPSSDPYKCTRTWNATPSIVTNPVKEGAQSLKLVTTLSFGGAEIKSQEDRCDDPLVCPQQSKTYSDLAPQSSDPQQYDQLTFWIKQYGPNKMGNNVFVKFFDRGNYANGTELWTAQTGDYGKWSRITVPFSSLPQDFKFHDMKAIELMEYWPGTYYFDDLRALKATPPVIEKRFLPSGIITWKPVPGAARYTLQESTTGPDSGWKTLYAGPETIYISSRLTKSWLRLRWETASSTAQGTTPYYSDWSDTAAYYPKPVLIRNYDLQHQGIVDWSYIPQTGYYEIQQGNSRLGAWTTIYKGTFKVPPALTATLRKWYRARAFKMDVNGTATETGEWSPALLYDPNSFIKTSTTALREKGTGPVVTLRGVNLGNMLSVESWMFFGSNNPLIETFPDHHTIAEALTSRPDIGDEGAIALRQLYQHTYIQEVDLDNLMRMGINCIRLPFYYGDIRTLDNNGQWAQDDFDFSALDRIVTLCADRAIYVLLDLHGAPGAQSKEYHTGRINYNKLFDPENDVYRQRTVELWKALALHYKTNTSVIGYDLLNEPYGAISPEYYPTVTQGYQALWNLYNRIYKAIRRSTAQGGAYDTNHIILMEAIPSDNEWDSLPAPSAYGWSNVMYQLHYYGFTYDEDTGKINGTMTYDEHVQFLNQKLAQSKQIAYRVPVLIGECNGFNDGAIWDLLLKTFNAQGWSWNTWSYKIKDYPSEWGLYNHSLYTKALPDFNLDTLEVLREKIKDYDTPDHHTPNASLIQYINTHALLPGYMYDLKATKANASVSLAWTAPYSPSAITLYRVRYGTTASGTLNSQLTTTSTKATITGLTNGVSYTFRVEAVNATGTGPLSNTATTTPSL